MTMRDANRYALFCGQLPHESAVQIDVAVHGPKRSMSPDDIIETQGETNRVFRVARAMDFPAERTNLRVVGGFLCGLYQKMKFEFAPVDLPERVHEPGLHTATVHTANHMKNLVRHTVFGLEEHYPSGSVSKAGRRPASSEQLGCLERFRIA